MTKRVPTSPKLVDTSGFSLDPFPTSWGISAPVMDAAVDLSAALVTSGMSFDDAATAAIAMINNRMAKDN